MTQIQAPTAHALQRDIIAWAAAVFPDRTPKDVLIKMFEEVGEMIKKPTDVMEAADVMILLLDFIHFYGIDGDSLMEAVRVKMDLNKVRQWAVDRRTGIMHHV